VERHADPAPADQSPFVLDHRTPPRPRKIRSLPRLLIVSMMKSESTPVEISLAQRNRFSYPSRGIPTTLTKPGKVNPWLLFRAKKPSIYSGRYGKDAGDR
jgi:hypothetical protein